MKKKIMAVVMLCLPYTSFCGRGVEDTNMFLNTSSLSLGAGLMSGFIAGTSLSATGASEASPTKILATGGLLGTTIWMPFGVSPIAAACALGYGAILTGIGMALGFPIGCAASYYKEK